MKSKTCIIGSKFFFVNKEDYVQAIEMQESKTIFLAMPELKTPSLFLAIN